MNTGQMREELLRENSFTEKHISNKININRKGIGYISWPEETSLPTTKTRDPRQDIEVATTDLMGALNGDMVKVEVVSMTPRPRGRVVEVTSRAKTDFVATLKKEGGRWLAITDDRRVYRPMCIVSPTEELEEGRKALITLELFTGEGNPTARIKQVLGFAGEHRTELNAIVLERGFATEFPSEVSMQAKKIEAEHSQTISAEAPTRTDYRGVTTFTIDPLDAKDFDDALSVQTLADGTYEVGVHIADATFFVTPGTPLGIEAQKRATSVYLVDTTIPMLPHELSGNVCSLREGEDRLTFSAVFIIDKDANVLAKRFEKSIINSNKRFTYEEAQEVLDAQSGLYLNELNILRDLSRIMRSQREKKGALDFGDNEVKFTLDADGKPVSVVRKTRIETNLMIEEFMLLANCAVAEYLSEITRKSPEARYVSIYRIHDKPKSDRLEELGMFVRALGIEFGNNKRDVTAQDIRTLLHDISGRPQERLIRTATLRTMAKAVYSTKNIGHFGLSFAYYTHFTSPIRRYPDMLVHRTLAAHLLSKPLSKEIMAEFENLCVTSTEQEIKAADAERDSIRYKQIEFMLTKIGQEFDGTITGVTDWGLYVEEAQSAAEGLVHIKNIGNEFFSHSAKEYALVGERTKKKYALGDSVRVKLTGGSLADRTLDFVLV